MLEAFGVAHLLLHRRDEGRATPKELGLLLGHDDGGSEHQRAVRLFVGKVAIMVRKAPEGGTPATVKFDEHDRRFIFSHTLSIAIVARRVAMHDVLQWVMHQEGTAHLVP
jgi:hypothetical protein